jgi:hypothetical protein
VNVVERVDSFRNLVTSSFENVMGRMEHVHQISVEMSVDLLTELRLPASAAESFKETHRRALRTVYGSICEVNNEFGDLVVTEAELLSRFFNGLIASLTGSSSDADGQQGAVRLDIDRVTKASSRRLIG